MERILQAWPLNLLIIFPLYIQALTWILKDCFGGNCHTVMLAAVSPSVSCHNETLNTLRFANQAKNIVNDTRVNEVRNWA